MRASGLAVAVLTAAACVDVVGRATVADTDERETNPDTTPDIDETPEGTCARAFCSDAFTRVPCVGGRYDAAAAERCAFGCNDGLCRRAADGLAPGEYVVGEDGAGPYRTPLPAAGGLVYQRGDPPVPAFYDVGTGRERVLAPPGALVRDDLAVYGEWVVWIDARHAVPGAPDTPALNTEVYAHRLSTGLTLRLTEDASRQRRVRVYQGTAAFEDDGERGTDGRGRSRIDLIDIETRARRTLVRSAYQVTLAAYDGNGVVGRLDGNAVHAGFIADPAAGTWRLFALAAADAVIGASLRGPFVAAADGRALVLDAALGALTVLPTAAPPSGLSYLGVGGLLAAQPDIAGGGVVVRRIDSAGRGGRWFAAAPCETPTVSAVHVGCGGARARVAVFDDCRTGVDTCNGAEFDPATRSCVVENNLCSGTAACRVRACAGNVCRVSVAAGPCDDGDPTTTGDTCNAGRCAGTAADTDCPGRPEMARVPGTAVCIDRREAVIRGRADCGGSAYGRAAAADPDGTKGADDYPAGFPDRAGSGGTVRGVPTAAVTSPLYACPAGDEVPSAYLTWFQADAACRLAGKRLCRVSELQAACSAGGRTTAPRVPPSPLPGVPPDACRSAASLPDDTAPAPARAGASPDCVTAAGVADILGNVAEWAADDCPEPGNSACAVLYGASYLDGFDRMRCDGGGLLYVLEAARSFSTTGVRCCLDR